MLLPLLTCGPYALATLVSFSSFFDSTAQRLPKGTSPCRTMPSKGSARYPRRAQLDSLRSARDERRPEGAQYLATNAYAPGPPGPVHHGDHCDSREHITGRKEVVWAPRCRSSFFTAPGSTTYPHGWHIASETANNPFVARLAGRDENPVRAHHASPLEAKGTVGGTNHFRLS